MKKDYFPEYGSDYHFCTNAIGNPVTNITACKSSFFGNCRHALQHLLSSHSWKRIWLPFYYCYDVVDAIRETGIHVSFYADSPTADDVSVISKIRFHKNDVLLRMNYFGLRSWRDNRDVPVPVIEDHSHDLTGQWARKSNAQWVVASLRKTLPLPEGGILWSPLNLPLPPSLIQTTSNELLCYKRLTAMLLKTLWLQSHPICKDDFRQLYMQTESDFELLGKSDMAACCKKLLSQMDAGSWYHQKRQNWKRFSSFISDKVSLLQPENFRTCNPYSWILQCRSKTERDELKERLIGHHIYPAILWQIPIDDFPEIVSLSQTLLSIPCDARYSATDIQFLISRIKEQINR